MYGKLNVEMGKGGVVGIKGRIVHTIFLYIYGHSFWLDGWMDGWMLGRAMGWIAFGFFFSRWSFICSGPLLIYFIRYEYIPMEN